MLRLLGSLLFFWKGTKTGRRASPQPPSISHSCSAPPPPPPATAPKKNVHGPRRAGAAAAPAASFPYHSLTRGDRRGRGACPPPPTGVSASADSALDTATAGAGGADDTGLPAASTTAAAATAATSDAAAPATAGAGVGATAGTSAAAARARRARRRAHRAHGGGAAAAAAAGGGGGGGRAAAADRAAASAATSRPFSRCSAATRARSTASTDAADWPRGSCEWAPRRRPPPPAVGPSAVGASAVSSGSDSSSSSASDDDETVDSGGVGKAPVPLLPPVTVDAAGSNGGAGGRRAGAVGVGDRKGATDRGGGRPALSGGRWDGGLVVDAAARRVGGSGGGGGAVRHGQRGERRSRQVDHDGARNAEQLLHQQQLVIGADDALVHVVGERGGRGGLTRATAPLRHRAPTQFYWTRPRRGADDHKPTDVRRRAKPRWTRPGVSRTVDVSVGPGLQGGNGVQICTRRCAPRQIPRAWLHPRPWRRWGGGGHGPPAGALGCCGDASARSVSPMTAVGSGRRARRRRAGLLGPPWMALLTEQRVAQRCMKLVSVSRYARAIGCISELSSSFGSSRSFHGFRCGPRSDIQCIADRFRYCASHKNWIRNIRFSIINRPLSQ
ncbi:LOW QUALITY PROTEIN: hypothetical protein BU14_1044s0001 [Porphyra umbilicalis]|uniref:Uncharacterized protein n=1 Tax=Porphyra umbilicalis TaxID=2786 RepID=A0A1X6NN18_PORUM|nr:LOW QUALITY PROTEIN: hypothetical protein BU14_1044s0001 [Porphyra umbilicalis]|eukprot:OSX69876.1 LOW QUALITY PROTEIN: hypothetical protein BU14_1044s0001 [Porphyra umbilicalis]